MDATWDTGYETPTLSPGQARLSVAFTFVHAALKRSSPLFSIACVISAPPPRTPPRYSEIEKELLARQDAARFGATSGAHPPAGGNLKPGRAVQRS
jgi:hypothetical protein